MMRISS